MVSKPNEVKRLFFASCGHLILFINNVQATVAMTQKSNISVDEVQRFVKGFWCSMLMSSVFRCSCVPTFHVLLYRCHGVPSFVFTYSGILVLAAPVYITFSSSSYNVEGVFNSVVAGKFVRYFQPSWCSTRFFARKSRPLSFHF